MRTTVLNCRALVASFDPFNDATNGRFHFVYSEYTDWDGIPEDTIIWERKINATLLEPTTLLQVATDTNS